MNKINKEIKNKFVFFTELVSGIKIILSKTILLKPKRSNLKWLMGKSEVRHQTKDELIIFLIESSKINNKYGIKLICSDLTKEPFFRFDSDGPSHKNNFPDIPLEEQSITTPHFNTFKEDGKRFAYRNKDLKNEDEAIRIMENRDLGVILFCKETNSKLSSNNYPSVFNQEQELSFMEKQNINYDNLNFE